MDREAIYDAWAPPRGAWSLWVKPVLFGHMPERSDAKAEYPTPLQWAWDVFGEVTESLPAEIEKLLQDVPVDWAPAASENVMIVLDLPEDKSIRFGLALAGRGYRPVPLFNGCAGPSELIDQRPILRGLRIGAAYLAGLKLPDNAPPVFLLDDRRQSLPRPLRAGMLDNRWRVFAEDFPSVQVLRERKISRGVLIQPHEDLGEILRMWQQGGIELEVRYLSALNTRHPLVVPRIPWYRRWWHRFLSRFGVGPEYRPRDGFGYIVREPRHG